jgi:hypothetical protein
MKVQALKSIIKEIIREEVDGILRETSAPGLTFVPLEDSPDIGSIQESDVKDIGARARTIPDEEMKNYMGRVAAGAKTKKDRYDYPYIHRSNIETVDVTDDSGNPQKTIDIEAFKRLVAKRPPTLLKQNAKLAKTGGETLSFFNTSLPALKGLIINEKTNEFMVVDTCPSAGLCKTFCYAKKGGYVQWKASSLNQTRILNFLFNDWEGYRDQMIRELNQAASREGKKDKKTVLRWNDSGDMLSDKYFEIVMDIARATPQVHHYVYTKEVAKAKAYPNKPDNFIFNFSHGAIPTQDKLIDTEKDKMSVVVPQALVKDFIHKDKESGKWVYNSEEDVKKIKQRLAAKYNVDVKTVLTGEELVDTPKGQKGQYNVIVLPDGTDYSASRDDVRGTFLIFH